MVEGRIDEVAVLGYMAAALGLLYLLGLYLPTGMAFVVAVTSGIAWQRYRARGQIDGVAVPAVIGLAYCVAQFSPMEARPLIALLFVAGGCVAGMVLRSMPAQAGQ